MKPVEYEDVHVAFGRNVVFTGLSLSVLPGEVLSLIGPSGCGKSVLLKLALGLTRQQQGRVAIEGEEIDPDDEEGMLAVRRKIGMVFQWGALFDSLNVFDNIAYPMRERGVRDLQHLRERVAEALEMIGLPGIEQQMPAELSGGMRKRVALARAVVEEPRMLFYDEPTTGLDPINVRRISELISDLSHRLNVTSLVVTHDLPSAYMISDRIAMIGHKRLLAIDTPEAMQKSTDRDVRKFLDAMPFLSERARQIASMRPLPPGVPPRGEQ